MIWLKVGFQSLESLSYYYYEDTAILLQERDHGLKTADQKSF